MASSATISNTSTHHWAHYSAAIAASASSSYRHIQPYPSPNSALIPPPNGSMGYNSPLNSPGAYSNFSNMEYPWPMGHEMKHHISPSEGFYGTNGSHGNLKGGNQSGQNCGYGSSSTSSSR
jgi:hypothetical protein